MGALYVIMESTTFTNNKIEDLTLEAVKEAVASLKVPDKVLVKIELTPKDFAYVKEHTETIEIAPLYGVPVIVNEDIKKSRIFYKTSVPFCLRCGVVKKKGYYESGCGAWGLWQKRHVWNNSKEIQKAKERLNVA